MFGFLFHKKRGEVKRILHGRMNRAFVKQIDNKGRETSRGAYCEVVWVLPYDHRTKRADFDQVRPVVTKDISSSGMSLIHNEPLTDEKVVVGLHCETDRKFLLCTLQHCTPLGYGFYMIGLCPDEVLSIELHDCEIMEQIMGQSAHAAVPA